MQNNTPTSFDLRVFAALQAAFVPFLGWIALGRPAVVPTFVWGLIVVTGFIGVAGLIKPRLVVAYRSLWMTALRPIQWLVSRVLLAAVFYGVFTPIGLLLRLVRRPGASGWIEHESRPLTEHLWRMW